MKKYRHIFKHIKNNTVYLLLRTIIGLFRILPRKTSLALGSLLGRVAPFIARKEYGLSVKHLMIAFGSEKDEMEIRKLARETFRFLAMNFVDAARLQKMSSEQVKNICIPHNIERVKNILAQGHGAICLTSHTGCWEMLGAYLTAVGIPLAAVARRLYDPRLEKLLLETRKHSGIEVISRGHNTRDIIRSLKKGYLLAVLIDQDTKVKGVFVDFFGQPAHTATAPASLSRKYKVPIIPIFTYLDELYRHHIFVGKPIEIKMPGNKDDDIIRLTVQCSIATERFIRVHPEQWVWFHKRWKKAMM